MATGATGPPPPLYLYKLDSNLDRKSKMSQLHQEIEDSLEIGKSLESIKTEYRSGRVWFKFSEMLSNSEKESLETLINDHMPNLEDVAHAHETISPRVNMFRWSNYVRGLTYIYVGSKRRKLLGAKAISHMDTGLTSYSIRIYDKTNNKVIVDQSLTNTEEQANELTPLANIPEDEAVFEISIKKVGGNRRVYLDSITFFFNH